MDRSVFLFAPRQCCVTPRHRRPWVVNGCRTDGCCSSGGDTYRPPGTVVRMGAKGTAVRPAGAQQICTRRTAELPTSSCTYWPLQLQAVFFGEQTSCRSWHTVPCGRRSQSCAARRASGCSASVHASCSITQSCRRRTSRNKRRGRQRMNAYVHVHKPKSGFGWAPHHQIESQHARG